MDYLLQKKALSKLNLFKFFSRQNDPCSLANIPNRQKLSRSSLNRHILSLADDLNDLFDEDNINLFSTQQGYYLKNTSSLSSALITDKLQLHYLSNTTEFILLEALLEKNYSSIQDLADDLFLSTSYAYRCLNNIKNFLVFFSIELSFENRTGASNFIGSEQNLRFFFYYFILYSYRGLHYPFKRIELEGYKENLECKLDNFLNHEQIASSKKNASAILCRFVLGVLLKRVIRLPLIQTSMPLPLLLPR